MIKNWSKKRLKYFAKVAPATKRPCLPDDSEVTFLPMTHIRNGYFKPNTAPLSTLNSSYNSFENGDILMAKVTPCFEIGNIVIAENLVNDFGYGTSEIFVIRPDIKKINRKFLVYALQEHDFKQCAVSEMSGVGGLRRIPSSFVESYTFKFPPIDEQRAIAEFLDDRCGKIDGLIALEEKVIIELKEAIRGVVRKYVKNGAYKDHKIVDSKSIWVGDKPESWEVLRGKHILRLLTRPVLDTDTVVTCFRDGEVTLRSNRREDGFTMSEKEIGYQGVEAGDLVIHGMDGFAGAIGISDSRGKGSPILNICDTDENKRFIMYYLRCLAYDDVFLYLATGVRVRSCDLRWSKIADMDFVIPSRKEQALIVDKIEKECGIIKQLITLKQQKIAELKEYKKSLIYEYVTGKKEVPTMGGKTA